MSRPMLGPNHSDFGAVVEERQPAATPGLRSPVLLVQPASIVWPISFAPADLKPKPCAQCGRTFTPSNTLQTCCNLRCASGGRAHA